MKNELHLLLITIALYCFQQLVYFVVYIETPLIVQCIYSARQYAIYLPRHRRTQAPHVFGRRWTALFISPLLLSKVLPCFVSSRGGNRSDTNSDVVIYYILIRIRIRILSNTNVKRIVRIRIRIRIPCRFET